jgi:hypothetical protein
MTPHNLSQKAYVKGSTRKLIERGRGVYVGRFINKSRLLNKTSSLSKESVQIVKILLQLFFFDKSICYIKRRKRGATLSTLGVYKRDQGEKENNVRKSTKLIAPGASQPVVQEKRVTRKKWRSLSLERAGFFFL